MQSFCPADLPAKPCPVYNSAMNKVSKGSARRTMWFVFLNVTGYSFLLTVFGYLAAFEHFDGTRPTTPSTENGRFIPQNNHGHIVYLNDRERKQLLALQEGAIGFFLAATVAGYFYKKELGRKLT